MTPRAGSSTRIVPAAVLSVFALAGCADVGQSQAEVPLYVSGTQLERPIDAVGDVTLTIDRAELAFGPLYLCAGAQAGDLCDAARLEWLGSVRIDLTEREPERAGTLSGTTGRVRSWMYDMGISSQLTREQPFVLEAAQELGGASLVVEGRARQEGSEVPFAVAVVVQQGTDVERGVPVVRKSTADVFNHDVTGAEAGLWVTFDANPWLASMDLRPELEASACRTEGECAEPLRLDPERQAYRGLHHAVVSGRRPELSWDPLP
jgi:hypothetical protein